MEMYDIFIAYVSWGDGGKKRPVLILEQGLNYNMFAGIC